MDYADVLTAIGIAGTGVGGYIGGRINGRSSASQIASDTVEMLQAQIEVLKGDKEHREIELSDLRSRVTILEGLVTQRAEVEELGSRISLVKDTVDSLHAEHARNSEAAYAALGRIEMKVGTCERRSA